MTSSPPVVRIVVADDHHVVRTGFAALLDTQPDFAVVGTADDGAEAVRICRELSPDVVLMDVRMPGMDGIEATRQLTGSGPDRSPGPRILILTTFDLDSYVYDALCAGASGFLLKDVTAERLFEAVRVIAAGEALLAPAVTRRLISEFTRLRPRPETPAAGALATLTPRETQVLRLVAEGLSNPEVAARLVVTEETVKTHVSRMLTKLGLRDRTQAVVTAYELGLVVPGSRDPGSAPGLSAAACFTRERHEERVTLCVYLVAGLPGDGLPDQAPVLRQYLCIAHRKVSSLRPAMSISGPVHFSPGKGRHRAGGYCLFS